MLWSIFITYIITHHGLGGFSGLIHGLIAAAIGALSMLMSEPTAKSYVKRTCMFVLSIATFTFTFTFTKIYKKTSNNDCTNVFSSYVLLGRVKSAGVTRITTFEGTLHYSDCIRILLSLF